MLLAAALFAASTTAFVIAHAATRGGALFNPSGPQPDRFNAAGLYSSFDTIFSANLVVRSATPSVFRYGAQPAVLYSYDAKCRSIDDYLSHVPVTSFAIVKDDVILSERYQYGRNDKSRFLMQSMSKTVIATLLGIAVSEHLIASTNDTVDQYVPELRGYEYGRTKLRDLLHMASGVKFTENGHSGDDLERLDTELFHGHQPTVEVIKLFNTRTAAPGTRYYYASIESEVLGLVVARATHRSVASYLQEKIWQPMGAEADASWVLDTSRQEVAFCCMSASLRDMARFGMLLARDGAKDGRQLVPRAWLLAGTTVAPSEPFLAPGVAMKFFGYGYQVRVFPGKERIFELHGLRGQAIFVDPARLLVMVNTAVTTPTDAADEEALALWNGLVAYESRAPSPCKHRNITGPFSTPPPDVNEVGND